MKNYGKWFATAGLATLISTSALAAIDDVKDMQNGSQINVTGTVDRIKNEREFTLRDETGRIDVDIKSSQSVVLKEGDAVTVNGVLDKNLLGMSDIDAGQVTVNKKMSQAIGDAIEGRTELSLEGATSYDISNLPREGLVKVSGTVTDVDNEKNFTVRDDTGSINVDVESSETAALTEGAEVTVIGYVDTGLLGKDINASKVLVTANAGNTAVNPYQ